MVYELEFKKDLVSIIIPIFNRENTIENTIISIVNQSYANFEIILIDDGSTDNTKLICDKLVLENKTISYYYFENSGVSNARNRGIQFAKGAYIVFIDSDDVVEPSFLEKLIAVFNEKAMAVCSILINFSNKKILKTIPRTDLTKEHFLELYENDLFNSPCNKMYSTKIIRENKINFIPGLQIGEDFFFNMEYIHYVDRVRFVAEPLYIYNIMEMSLKNIPEEIRYKVIDNKYKKLKEFNARYGCNKLKMIYYKTLNDYTYFFELFLLYSQISLFSKISVMKKVISLDSYKQSKAEMSHLKLTRFYKYALQTNSPIILIVYFSIIKIRKSRKVKKR